MDFSKVIINANLCGEKSRQIYLRDSLRYLFLRTGRLIIIEMSDQMPGSGSIITDSGTITVYSTVIMGVIIVDIIPRRRVEWTLRGNRFVQMITRTPFPYYETHDSRVFNAVMTQSIDSFPTVDHFSGQVFIGQNQVTTPSVSPLEVYLIDRRPLREGDVLIDCVQYFALHLTYGIAIKDTTLDFVGQSFLYDMNHNNREVDLFSK